MSHVQSDFVLVNQALSNYVSMTSDPMSMTSNQVSQIADGLTGLVDYVASDSRVRIQQALIT